MRLCLVATYTAVFSCGVDCAIADDHGTSAHNVAESSVSARSRSGLSSFGELRVSARQ